MIRNFLIPMIFTFSAPAFAGEISCFADRSVSTALTPYTLRSFGVVFYNTLEPDVNSQIAVFREEYLAKSGVSSVEIINNDSRLYTGSTATYKDRLTVVKTNGEIEATEDDYSAAMLGKLATHPYGTRYYSVKTGSEHFSCESYVGPGDEEIQIPSNCISTYNTMQGSILNTSYKMSYARAVTFKVTYDSTKPDPCDASVTDYRPADESVQIGGCNLADGFWAAKCEANTMSDKNRLDAALATAGLPPAASWRSIYNGKNSTCQDSKGNVYTLVLDKISNEGYLGFSIFVNGGKVPLVEKVIMGGQVSTVWISALKRANPGK